MLVTFCKSSAYGLYVLDLQRFILLTME